MKSIIVAYDKHNGIGANNDLLWQGKLPADLRHFKATTMGSTVIMGYNTYKSIGKPLPGRRNIVISEKPLTIDGFDVVDTLLDAFNTSQTDESVFVIGGGYIYSLAIDLVDRIFATEVDALFENATVFFPTVDLVKWREVKRAKNSADENNLYNYDFVIYDRIN